MFKVLDAGIRQGTYDVLTNNGTHYFMELSDMDDGVRVISDGKGVSVVRDCVIGGCCIGDDPMIRVGRPMHLAANGSLIVITSSVVSIEKIRDGLDDLVCSTCCGYKHEGVRHRCLE